MLLSETYRLVVIGRPFDSDTLGLGTIGIICLFVGYAYRDDGS